MSEPKTSTAEILVHLVRPEGGQRDYHLSYGATLADLLRMSGASLASQAIAIDGVPIEETVRLSDGAVVTIASQHKDVESKQPWDGVITAFQDEALFREYMEILKENRRREYPEEDEGA